MASADYSQGSENPGLVDQVAAAEKKKREQIQAVLRAHKERQVAKQMAKAPVTTAARPVPAEAPLPKVGLKPAVKKALSVGQKIKTPEQAAAIQASVSASINEYNKDPTLGVKAETSSEKADAALAGATPVGTGVGKADKDLADATSAMSKFTDSGASPGGPVDPATNSSQEDPAVLKSKGQDAKDAASLGSRIVREAPLRGSSDDIAYTGEMPEYEMDAFRQLYDAIQNEGTTRIPDWRPDWTRGKDKDGNLNTRDVDLDMAPIAQFIDDEYGGHLAQTVRRPMDYDEKQIKLAEVGRAIAERRSKFGDTKFDRYQKVQDNIRSSRANDLVASGQEFDREKFKSDHAHKGKELSLEWARLKQTGELKDAAAVEKYKVEARRADDSAFDDFRRDGKSLLEGLAEKSKKTLPEVNEMIRRKMHEIRGLNPDASPGDVAMSAYRDVEEAIGAPKKGDDEKPFGQGVAEPK